jgi:phospholipase C
VTAWTGSVFTIVMENKSQGDIIGNSNAPYINKLAKENALAAGYHDSFVHPSEPNYFWMVSGENFGVLDDADPASHHLASTSHLADQLELGGLTWKSYQESMGDPCGLTSHGRYAAKHNPFVYFNDINGWDGTKFNPSPRCTDHVVDYSQLDVDLAANKLPKYAFITPNLDNDMHDGSIANGDAWLAREIPKLQATDAYKKGGVIFLLWDEGGGYPAGDDPPFLAISPNAQVGMVSQTDYDTSSYLKTVQTMLGVAPLPCDPAPDLVPTMDDLFTVPVSNTTK